MSNTVKMGTNLKGNYTISLPGGVRIVPGKVSEVPVELLSNPGIQAYLKTGKLYIQKEEAVIEVPPTPPSEPVTVVSEKKPAKEKKPKAEKTEVTAESVQEEVAQAVADVQAEASTPTTE